MSIKIISLVPNLGFYCNPAGTILEVDEKTAERCLSNGTAKLYQEKEDVKPPKVDVDLDGVNFKTVPMGRLREIAKELGIKGSSRKYRKELTELIKDKIKED